MTLVNDCDFIFKAIGSNRSYDLNGGLWFVSMKVIDQLQFPKKLLIICLHVRYFTLMVIGSNQSHDLDGGLLFASDEFIAPLKFPNKWSILYPHVRGFTLMVIGSNQSHDLNDALWFASDEFFDPILHLYLIKQRPYPKDEINPLIVTYAEKIRFTSLFHFHRLL